MDTIYEAADILEAHIVAGMLNAEGIEAEVAGHYQQGGVGELAPRDFARVTLLDERDHERARALIRAYEQTDASEAEEAPVRDGSSADGESTRLGLLLVVGAVVLLLVSWGVFG
ncbi:DUF2007 domain-containing protein [Guyparkeria sp. 1SP6A2]|nr:DUF2007 domain-containing protein [Guyparkeria sp. 1SP6A2]